MPYADDPGPDDHLPPSIMPLGEGTKCTDRYEQVDPALMRNVLMFRVLHSPPRPGATEAQIRAMRRDTENEFLVLSVSRLAAHIAATQLGFPAACKRPACRRAKLCTGLRHERDWSFPGPHMVPCARTIRTVETVRAKVRELCAAPAPAGPVGDARPTSPLRGGRTTGPGGGDTA